ncbi:MAG: hypothetical protein CBC37_03250 [Acidimicrobiaceae bacterium TMED77]|nr:hypothetical protein [Acidimicrobiales bacterium]OUV00816.1 MAG: hypothetical protein CBC37_03250 [Acidimicrobiaceae bacterium TMED77]|tara:strand:+ start:1486 stop:1701 length:216 start_codon:yes stop_codon:yes gene_type:complete
MPPENSIEEESIAELSSISFQIEDLISRVTSTAKRLESEGSEASSHELYEVERSLLSALRRLRRATSELKL